MAAGNWLTALTIQEVSRRTGLSEPPLPSPELAGESATRLPASSPRRGAPSRSTERGQAAAAGLGARFVQLDVADDASVAAAVKTLDDAEGHLDVLVNNAGIGLEALNGPDTPRVCHQSRTAR